MSAPTQNNPGEDPLRPHTYDGIQEYDKRLPNWWLFTLYGAMVFSFVYWLFYHLSGVGLNPKQALAQELAAVEAARLASSLGTLSDADLWAASRNPQFVEPGKTVFTANCVACHLSSLRGKDENPAAVGPSLVDNVWIHGNRPADLRTTVTAGVLAKGMPAWGPVLGDKKVVEAVAYVLSYHQPPADAGAAPPATPAPK
jgi:cytochrome c oxidase cbb3-type subunit III